MCKFTLCKEHEHHLYAFSHLQAQWWHYPAQGSLYLCKLLVKKRINFHYNKIISTRLYCWSKKWNTRTLTFFNFHTVRTSSIGSFWTGNVHYVQLGTKILFFQAPIVNTIFRRICIDLAHLFHSDSENGMWTTTRQTDFMIAVPNMTFN